MIITRDEYTFFANDSIQKAWIQKKDMFLHRKGQDQGIMTFKFILLFGQLNLVSLLPKKREKIMQKIELIETKAIEVFKYRKNNDGYQDGAKLH